MTQVFLAAKNRCVMGLIHKEFKLKNMMCALTFATALFAQNLFAGWVDVVANPTEAKLELENANVDWWGMDRILIAPWFKVNLTIYNDHGRDVVVRNLQVDITSADGKTESHPVYHWLEAQALPAN